MNETVTTTATNRPVENIREISKLPKVKNKTKTSTTPNRFSVRGMRRHGGIIISRNPQIGF